MHRPFCVDYFRTDNFYFTSVQLKFASLSEASEDNENLRASERADRKKKYLILWKGDARIPRYLVFYFYNPRQITLGRHSTHHPLASSTSSLVFHFCSPSHCCSQNRRYNKHKYFDTLNTEWVGEREYGKGIFIVKYILLYIIAQKSLRFANQFVQDCSLLWWSPPNIFEEFSPKYFIRFRCIVEVDVYSVIQFNDSNIVSRKADQIQRQQLLFSVPNLETTALAPKWRLTNLLGNSKSLIITKAGNLNIRTERNTLILICKI